MVEAENDPLQFIEELEGKDYGVIRPGFGGRWNWPLSIMEPGDYFHVAHEDKAPGNLRHLVSVRAAQLGVTFSVRKDSPRMAGYTIVICTPPREMREQAKGKLSTIDYQLALHRLVEHYSGIQFDREDRIAALYDWKESFAEGEQVKEPRHSRWVFRFANITVGMIFKKDGVLFMRLPDNATPLQWERMEEQWEKERAKWIAEEARRREKHIVGDPNHLANLCDPEAIKAHIAKSRLRYEFGDILD